MKNENKEIILADLYSLRAGMSFVSIQNDLHDSEERKLRDITYRIEDNTASIMNYDSIIDKSKKSLKHAKHDYESAKRKYDKVSFPSFLWKLITVISLIVTAYIFITRDADSSYIFLINLLCVVCAAFTLFAFVKALIKDKKARPLRKKMKEAKSMMKDSSTWIEEGTDGMKSTEEENRGLESTKNQLTSMVKDSNTIFDAISESSKNALEEAFQSFLSRTYWNKIDLIIYLIKSERAGSLDEALLEVDNMLSFSRTEETVERAHASISAGIDKDIEYYAEMINSSFGKLALKFEECKSTAANNRKLNALLVKSKSEGVKYFTENITAASLIKALKLKSEVNSMVLSRSVDDMIYN